MTLANNTREAGKPVRLVPGLGVRAGQTICGKYRVDELLGTKGSGVTIAARNVHLDLPVTLEILASYTDTQEELVKRRLAKARQAARLRSEHVARIVDIGVTHDALPYVASESLVGRTLEAELEERKTLPVEEAVRWALEACEALAEAHAAGLVHGALEPKNLLLVDATDDRPRRLVVLDFGATSPLEGIGAHTASALFGSPAYVAPEQIKDPTLVDPRVDLWALGVLLYRMIAGSLPFAADSVSGLIVAVVYDEAALLRDAPYELAAIVASCLSKDPEKRPHDVSALAASLEPFAGEAGKRLSERVAVMLDAPPASLPQGFAADESGSFPALALTPLPPRKGAPKQAAFRPSWRVAGGLAAAVAAFGLLTWTAVENVHRPLPAAVETATASESDPVSTTTVSAADLPGEHPPADVVAAAALANAEAEAVPEAPPEALPEAPAASGETTPVSFAPSAAHPATPTPLATARPIPTVAVEALRAPPAATGPATPLPPPARPAPPPMRAPTAPTAHTHRGIPTTREASSSMRMTVDPRY